MTVKKRTTLITVAIVCGIWALPIPGLDPFPIVIDDIFAGIVSAGSIIKLLRSNKDE